MEKNNNKGQCVSFIIRNCRECFYAVVCERSNTAANAIEYMACKRYPTETKHRPDNWCGEWKRR